MKLSILIPTVKEDSILFARLLDALNRQIGNDPDIEILIDDREPPVSTGTKRNDLTARASGLFVVFIDADDLILNDYIHDIMQAIELDPDCITFTGFMTTNGANRQNFVLRLGEKYEMRSGVYYRWPNHIVPIKKSIASQVRFPDTTQGEDYAWSKHLNDLKLIKTEVHINKDLYYYDCRTKPQRRK